VVEFPLMSSQESSIPKELTVKSQTGPPALQTITAIYTLHKVHTTIWTPAAGTYLRLFQTIIENSFIWRPKRLVTLLNL